MIAEKSNYISKLRKKKTKYRKIFIVFMYFYIIALFIVYELFQ